MAMSSNIGQLNIRWIPYPKSEKEADSFMASNVSRQ
jgi:hypothetical protein